LSINKAEQNSSLLSDSRTALTCGALIELPQIYELWGISEEK